MFNLIGSRTIRHLNSHRFRQIHSRGLEIVTNDSDPLILEEISKKEGFIIDMDGCIYDGGVAIEGAAAFLQWLLDSQKRFLLLTNSSGWLPAELSAKVRRIMGVHVPCDNFYTSGQSTARWLGRQEDRDKTAYVIGDPGLVNALYEEGFTMDDNSPTYVVVGETRNYHYEHLVTAINLIRKGSSFIATNPDLFDKKEHRPSFDALGQRIPTAILPACGTLTAPITAATGIRPFCLGKPNPLMIRTALTKLEVPREKSIVIGDRMDTDILAGVESEIDTALVLTGVTESKADLYPYAFRPKYYFKSLGSMVAKFG